MIFEKTVDNKEADSYFSIIELENEFCKAKFYYEGDYEIDFSKGSLNPMLIYGSVLLKHGLLEEKYVNGRFSFSTKSVFFDKDLERLIENLKIMLDVNRELKKEIGGE